jgi:dTDP-4-amino-4,6-dideoxygalactose transaminase
VYKGRKVGSIGDLAAFSFYANKNVVAGEGGMVTTNSAEFAEKIKVYALHGMSRDAWKRFSADGYKHYQVLFPGFKYNMMDLQAAIGLHQLARVKQNLERRNRIWQMYNEAFVNLPVGRPAPDEPDTLHGRHLYTLMIGEDRCGVSRDGFIQRMQNENIGCGVHYLGIHLHPYYRDRFGFRPEDFPNASWISERTVSIPLSPKLTECDASDVIDAVKKVVG